MAVILDENTDFGRNAVTFAGQARDAALRAAQLGQQQYQFGVDTALKQQQMAQSAAQFQQNQGLEQAKLAQQGAFQQGELGLRGQQQQQQGQYQQNELAYRNAALAQQGQLQQAAQAEAQRQHNLQAYESMMRGLQSGFAEEKDPLAKQEWGNKINALNQSFGAPLGLSTIGQQDPFAATPQQPSAPTAIGTADSVAAAPQAPQSDSDESADNAAFSSTPQPQPPAWATPANSPSLADSEAQRINALPSEQQTAALAALAPADSVAVMDAMNTRQAPDKQESTDKLKDAVDAVQNGKGTRNQLYNAVQQYQDANGGAPLRTQRDQAKAAFDNIDSLYQRALAGNLASVDGIPRSQLDIQWKAAKNKYDLAQSAYKTTVAENQKNDKASWDETYNDTKDQLKQLTALANDKTLANSGLPIAQAIHAAKVRMAEIATARSNGEMRFSDWQNTTQQIDDSLYRDTTDPQDTRPLSPQDIIQQGNAKVASQKAVSAARKEMLDPNNEFNEAAQRGVIASHKELLPEDAKALENEIPSNNYANRVMNSLDPATNPGATADPADTQLRLKAKIADLHPVLTPEDLQNPYVQDKLKQLASTSETTRKLVADLEHNGWSASGGINIGTFGAGMNAMAGKNGSTGHRTGTTTIDPAIQQLWMTNVYTPTKSEAEKMKTTPMDAAAALQRAVNTHAQAIQQQLDAKTQQQNSNGTFDVNNTTPPQSTPQFSDMVEARRKAMTGAAAPTAPEQSLTPENARSTIAGLQAVKDSPDLGEGAKSQIKDQLSALAKVAYGDQLAKVQQVAAQAVKLGADKSTVADYVQNIQKAIKQNPGLEISAANMTPQAWKEYADSSNSTFNLLTGGDLDTKSNEFWPGASQDEERNRAQRDPNWAKNLPRYMENANLAMNLATLGIAHLPEGSSPAPSASSASSASAPDHPDEIPTASQIMNEPKGTASRIVEESKPEPVFDSAIYDSGFVAKPGERPDPRYNNFEPIESTEASGVRQPREVGPNGEEIVPPHEAAQEMKQQGIENRNQQVRYEHGFQPASNLKQLPAPQPGQANIESPSALEYGGPGMPQGGNQPQLPAPGATGPNRPPLTPPPPHPDLFGDHAAPFSPLENTASPAAPRTAPQADPFENTPGLSESAAQPAPPPPAPQQQPNPQTLSGDLRQQVAQQYQEVQAKLASGQQTPELLQQKADLEAAQEQLDGMQQARQQAATNERVAARRSPNKPAVTASDVGPIPEQPQPQGLQKRPLGPGQISPEQQAQIDAQEKAWAEGEIQKLSPRAKALDAAAQPAGQNSTSVEGHLNQALEEAFPNKSVEDLEQMKDDLRKHWDERDALRGKAGNTVEGKRLRAEAAGMIKAGVPKALVERTGKYAFLKQ